LLLLTKTERKLCPCPDLLTVYSTFILDLLFSFSLFIYAAMSATGSVIK